MCDLDLPITAIRDVEGRLDMEWLFALMVEERLHPDSLVEAERRRMEAHLKLEDLLDDLPGGDELKRLLGEGEDADNEHYRLLEEFWLRVGIAIGSHHQWLLDQTEIAQHRHGPFPEQIRDELEDGLSPSEYLSSVMIAREAMQEARESAEGRTDG